jgi:hypothetical protein
VAYTNPPGVGPANTQVPPGEWNWIEQNFAQWEQTIGYQIPSSMALMLELANAHVTTQSDIGRFAAGSWSGYASILNAMPWAKYGLDKDTYQSLATGYGTEYKKVTGQQISPDALNSAFASQPYGGGLGLLSASQYAQQLMNDTAIQKQYGWVKYGLDFTQWTQQKLSLKTAFGRDINDAEASTILQYNKAAQGANVGATARSAQQQQATAGVAGSLVR